MMVGKQSYCTALTQYKNLIWPIRLSLTITEMKIMRHLFTSISKLAAGFILASSHIAFANDYSLQNHDAHVHGYAQLTLAAEKNTLFINIIVPAQSIVGFEHRAETSNEIAQVNKVKETLSQSNNIITLHGSGCALIDNNLDIEALLPVVHEHSGHSDHAVIEHSEVTVSYKFHCDNLADTSSATLHIFENYPEIETIRASWITERKQGAKNLTSMRNMLTWG